MRAGGLDSTTFQRRIVKSFFNTCSEEITSSVDEQLKDVSVSVSQSLLLKPSLCYYFSSIYYLLGALGIAHSCALNLRNVMSPEDARLRLQMILRKQC